MQKAQRTIKENISIEGIGLHTGNDVQLIFKPASENSGIRFVRTDLPNSPEIAADIDHVTDIVRGTTIAQDDVKIHTIEHVLAALVALEIDNLIIELDANEPPVMDGSSSAFVEALLKVGVVEQNATKNIFELDKTISVHQDNADIIALPSNVFRISYTLFYDHPMVGSQFYTIEINEETFRKEIAPARTFCFVDEIKQLKAAGLIQGGSLETAVVIADNSIVNEEQIRFENEFARHKILDIIGDLFLLGMPIRAHIIANRSGHSTNALLTKKLREYMQEKESKKIKLEKGKEIDIKQILKILPHRYPFLLVDKIIDYERGKYIIGMKNVTINEPFFIGHFPGHPIMPGVLILEAMAQVGAILLLSEEKNIGKLAYFAGMDKVKFRKPVLPGDQLRFEIEILGSKMGLYKIKGKTLVNGKVVAQAILKASVVDNS